MSSDYAEITAGCIALITIALIGGSLAERIRIPAAVAMVLIGAVANFVHPLQLPVDFGPALLYVFLPPLVFEAAWHIDLAALRRMGAAIAVLALPGAALTALFVAAVLALTGMLPFAAAFLFGAIISATDPVAISAIFRKLPVPVDLAVLIEGESLANDGTAIVLYASAVSIALATQAPSIPAASLHVVGAILGGLAIGTGLGVAVALLFTRRTEVATEGTATVALAFMSFLAAEHFGASGVFATASAAIALRVAIPRVGAHCDELGIDRFWTIVAYLANGLVFLGTGLELSLHGFRTHALLIIVAVAAVLIARLLLISALLPNLRDVRIHRAWYVTMYLAGMRGGVALALALALPNNLPYREEITTGVLATVVTTLVIQGIPLERILRRGFRNVSE